jgi:hypothetical protein
LQPSFAFGERRKAREAFHEHVAPELTAHDHVPRRFIGEGIGDPTK